MEFEVVASQRSFFIYILKQPKNIMLMSQTMPFGLKP